MRKVLRDKGLKKTSQTFDYLDYTPDELVLHLEAQFVEGMSWENMEKWHIDHIRPIASFNFDSVEHPEFRECWGLDNLQPL